MPWRPVWRKNDLEEAGDFYTIRVVKGRRQVIKRRSAHWYCLHLICAWVFHAFMSLFVNLFVLLIVDLSTDLFISL